MRFLNRVLAVFAALALLLGGLVAVVEIFVAAVLGRSPWLVPHDRWYRMLTTNSWESRGPRLAAILLLGLGLVLLLLQLIKRRPTHVTASSDDRVSVELHRASTEKALSRTLNSTDGAASGKVRWKGDTLKSHVSTNRRTPGSLAADVQGGLERHVQRLHVANSAPKVDVDLQTRKS